MEKNTQSIIITRGQRMKALVGVRLPRISVPTPTLASPLRSGKIIADGHRGKEPSEGQGSKPSMGEDAGEKDDGGNKVMVLIDSSTEAKSALEWTLSHVVQSQDVVVLLLLLHVVHKPSQKSEEKLNPRDVGLLQSMRNLCQLRRPGVRVEVSMAEAEGKEKGPAIVQEAKRRAVTLLVVGQRRRSVVRRVLLRWSRVRRWFGRGRAVGVAEYCIQNAGCMTIGVRRKNKKQGGYLITTKRHKNFWLLA
ncbi:hypothetical protein MLD38_031880 [Melastoma candidum]|uniref:Uncharacterized protein n=1 Tax=Melastoma candidum TaxID=119954 RepID=A0ACB9MRM4_9MYRT|nr:hypothetical protein MLD38_031880 [Melastoma candidum]